MTYSHILFDWDGCLAMTLEVWLESYKLALKKFGVTPPDKEIAHHFGDWSLPKYFAVEEYEACNTLAVATARKKLLSVDLYPGAKKLLLKLRDRDDIKVAVLSSASKDILNHGISHNELDTVFDVILSGEDVTEHKPNPEVIEKGLKAMGGTDAKAVMIGDSRKDIGAANNAKIDSVLIYPKQHELFYDLRVLQTSKPTYTVESFSELEKILL